MMNTVVWAGMFGWIFWSFGVCEIWGLFSGVLVDVNDLGTGK